MRKKRLFKALLFAGLLLACGILLSTCSNGVVQKPVVAVITKSTDSAFFKAVQAGANAACTEYNLKMTFEGPETEEDYEQQNAYILAAAKRGVEAIILSAIDYNRNASAVNEAAEMGTKIVVIDSDVNSNRVLCKIGTNNFEAGQQAAHAALSNYETDLYVGIINFDENTANGQAREKGFRDVLKTDSRVKEVTTINVISSIEAAKEGAIKLLREHPEINLICTLNEWTSLGVGYAIQELDMKNKVKTVAFDNNPVSIGMLESGEIDALLVQRPYAMGYLGVETAYKLITGTKIAEENVYTGATVVTRSNMYDPAIQQILFP